MVKTPKPTMVKVIFPSALGMSELNETRGIVGTGVSQDASHMKRGKTTSAVLTHVVKEFDPNRIAQQALELAQQLRPAFDACADALREIKVSEISVGCAISVEAGVMVAGVGAEASIEITFAL